ncbi:RepC, partial [Acinetobacter baumannii]|nr:RepC [Acinetobacter baumannii]
MSRVVERQVHKSNLDKQKDYRNRIRDT